MTAAAVTLVSVAVAGLVAWACGRGTPEVLGIPVLFVGAGLAFAINWVVFVPAILRKTERFYDLTGAVTYLAVVSVALSATWPPDARSVVLAALVTVWALRLGTFLFLRVLAAGHDRRFDAIKVSAPKFLIAFTLQGLWVFLTLSAALTAIASPVRAPLGIWFVLGAAMWVKGFLIEVVADAQKRRFRSNKDRAGEFITTGLWAWSRHPNYFGEILLWIGIAVMAAPTFSGGQWVALVSPLFVILLLTRVSGIPLLEKRADAKWGGRPDYEAYKARTPLLLLNPLTGCRRRSIDDPS